MLTKKDYYTTPPQDIFNEIKSKSMELWETYDNTYWYVDEKLSFIRPIENNQDNWLYIVWMFDVYNQHKLLGMVNDRTKEYLLKFLTN